LPRISSFCLFHFLLLCCHFLVVNKDYQSIVDSRLRQRCATNDVADLHRLAKFGWNCR